MDFSEKPERLATLQLETSDVDDLGRRKLIKWEKARGKDEGFS